MIATGDVEQKPNQSESLIIQGINMFDETLRLRKLIPSSCCALDELLEGGLFTQEVTEVFGPPAVGKTQLALTLTANTIVSMKGNVTYFDTSGTFSSMRLVEILESKEAFSQQAIKMMLSRVDICRPSNLFKLLSELEMLKEKLILEHDSFCLNLKLVIIDSITSVMTPILGGKKKYWQALMVKIGQLMKEIASEFGIALFVINSAVLQFEKGSHSSLDNFKPSLGKTWLPISHVRLFLNFSIKNKEERFLQIFKHPRLPSKVKITIALGRSGVYSS